MRRRGYVDSTCTQVGSACAGEKVGRWSSVRTVVTVDTCAPLAPQSPPRSPHVHVFLHLRFSAASTRRSPSPSPPLPCSLLPATYAFPSRQLAFRCSLYLPRRPRRSNRSPRPSSLPPSLPLSLYLLPRPIPPTAPPSRCIRRTSTPSNPHTYPPAALDPPPKQPPCPPPCQLPLLLRGSVSASPICGRSTRGPTLDSESVRSRRSRLASRHS